MAASVSQLWYAFACGYLENLSADTSMYESLLFSWMGPVKSICTSSLGSCKLGRCVCFFFGITGFKFLPICVHGLHLCAIRTISLWTRGNKNNCAMYIMPACPVWVLIVMQYHVNLGVCKVFHHKVYIHCHLRINLFSMCANSASNVWELASPDFVSISGSCCFGYQV